MKRVIQQESTFCDICTRGGAMYACLECKTDFCYGCSRTYTKEYHHGVHFSGSGDGRYCLTCDAKLAASRDQLYLAYKTIESLRDEEAGWAARFTKRMKEAENKVETLYSQRYPR